MLQAMPWGTSIALRELRLVKGLSQMVYRKLVFSHIPIPRGPLSYSVFLLSPVPNSFFFLGSCMWCCNEDRLSLRSGTWCFLSRWLQHWEDCGLNPFCQETVKCRENGNNRIDCSFCAKPTQEWAQGVPRPTLELTKFELSSHTS